MGKGKNINLKRKHVMTVRIKNTKTQNTNEQDSPNIGCFLLEIS